MAHLTHFIQLPNKTVELLPNELALKNGKIVVKFGEDEHIYVTEKSLRDAIAGMSAPLTVETKDDLDALTVDEVQEHQRIFVKDDGDGKWAYYMITDVSGDKPAYIKVSDEDIFGALFSDDVTAQISKIGDLADLNDGIKANLSDPATIIEAMNEIYAQHLAEVARVGDNGNLTTNEKATIVGAINELKVNIEANDEDILTIQNNMGDIAQINLADEADKENIVAALNKIIAVQNTKLDSEDVVPIIVSYTGVLTDLNTENKNSLVEAVNEVLAKLGDETARAISVEGDLANLVTSNKSNLVAAINEVKGMVDSEEARAKAAEDKLTSDLANEVTRAQDAEKANADAIASEAATRAANDGDLSTLTTDAKNNLVAAINEVDGNLDAEVARAKSAEQANTDALNAEVARATTAEGNIQAELDNTQVGAGLDENGNYVADDTTNFIATATNLAGADKLLDTQVKLNKDAIEAEVVRAQDAEKANAGAIADLKAQSEATDASLQSELDAVEASVGLAEDGSFVADTETNYLGSVSSVRGETKVLDGKVKENADAIAAEVTRAQNAEGDLQNQVNQVVSDLATEAQTRADADTALDDRLTTVEEQVNGKIGDLDSLTTDDKSNLVAAINEVDANADKNSADLEAEIARASAAEQANTDAINAEEARAKGVEGSVEFDESLNTTTTDEDGNEVVVTPADLTDAINKENARARGVEADLQAQIDSNAETTDGAIDDLRNDLDAEIARAKDAETTLDAKIDSAVADLVNGAPEVLDTLKELADAIADDPNFATTVANDIANAKAELRGAASEAMDTMGEIEAAFNDYKEERAKKDAAQDQALADEIARAQAAEQANADAIAKEVQDRTDADNTLQSNIDSEVERAQAAEKANADAIAKEVQDRTDADAVLDAKITNLEDQVDGKIGDLSTLTTDAKDNLVNAINEVDGNVDAEVVRAQAAEKANSDAINNEVVRAQGVEANIQAELDAVETSVGLGEDGSFTADANGNYIANATSVRNEIKLLDGQVKTNTDGLASEIARAQGVETNLQNAIDTEVARAKDAEKTNADAIATETTRATGAEANLQAAIDAEKVRATTAEGNLGFNSALQVDDGNGGTRLAANLTEAINAEVARASAAELNTSNALADEINRAKAAEGTLQSNIDNETARAQAAESQLADDLASEVDRAKAAESTLQANIDAEAQTRADADTNLQANIDAEKAARMAADGTLNFNEALNTTDSDGNTQSPTTLTDAINAEVNRAIKAESANANAISAEVDRAKAAEEALQTNIDNEVARAKAAEQANADAIAELEADTSALVGNLDDLKTDAKDNVVAAINEVQVETDVNTNQVALIKAFLNDVLAKSGKTVKGLDLVADEAYTIDVSDLASTDLTVSIYSVDGTLLSQEYGMFVDIDTANKTVSITSSVDMNVNVVILSDISSITIA